MKKPATKDAVIDIDDEFLRRWPLPLEDEGDKNDRGIVVIVAGSPEIPGAAVLAATAALRAGAGKVTIATVASIAQSVAFAVPESRVIALKETARGAIAAGGAATLEALAQKADALLIGPGLSYEPETRALTETLIGTFEKARIVLDAAAMDVVAMNSRGGRMRLSERVLLTPHPGEMAKLSGRDKEAVTDRLEDTALAAARDWNALVALKTATTYIAAPDQRLWRHEGGNFGLATSGSGDVLSGIIAGLIARGAALEQAAAWGVRLHARAGERLAERYGQVGYLARELSAEVPALMAALAA